jgi:hypothetical protein
VRWFDERLPNRSHDLELQREQFWSQIPDQIYKALGADDRCLGL